MCDKSIDLAAQRRSQHSKIDPKLIFFLTFTVQFWWSSTSDTEQVFRCCWEFHCFLQKVVSKQIQNLLVTIIIAVASVPTSRLKLEVPHKFVFCSVISFPKLLQCCHCHIYRGCFSVGCREQKYR